MLAILAACGGVALAVMQGGAPWAIAGMLVAAWITLHRQLDAAVADTTASGLGAMEIDAFDRLLAEIAGELTESHRATLREIKALIAGVAATCHAEGPTALEAQFFAAACVRRYVPDSLAAFIAVPVAQRAEPLLDARGNAIDLLTQQLGLIREELRAHLRQTGHEAAGALVRQQHFLRTRAHT